MTPDQNQQSEKGIVTIAFGPEYDRIAAHTMRYSRRFTDLPICVLTNLYKQDRHSAWDELENVTFDVFRGAEIHNNRWAKLQMGSRTPFDKTIYIDADALIQKPGIDCIFDMLDHADFVLNGPDRWRPGDKVPNIYARAMLACRAKLPLTAYNGGFFAWNTGRMANAVFSAWLANWLLTGKGRDMPALACAIQLARPLIFDVALSPVFAVARKDPNCIVQHNYNATFLKDFGLPAYQESKPFDSDPSDFKFVRFTEGCEDA